MYLLPYIVFYTILMRDAVLIAHVDRVAFVQAQSIQATTLSIAIVTAVETHATDVFTPALLLALVDVESDFDPTSTSRLVNGVRVTGNWRSTKRPPNAIGPYCCGVSQATGKTWSHCLALRDPDVALATTVASLVVWQRRGKTVRRALQGYGCGNAGLKGACKAYATRVFARMRLFMAPAPVRTHARPAA